MKTEPIRKLLEKYFEGETSLQEEKYLQDYFLSDEVSSELKPYQYLFSAFSEEKRIFITDDIIHTSNKTNTFSLLPKNAWWGIAATVLVLMGSWLMFQNNHSQEVMPSQQELLVAQKYLKQGFESFDKAYNNSSRLVSKTDMIQKETLEVEKMGIIYQKNMNKINQLKHIDQSFEKLQNISSMKKSRLKLVM